MKLNAISEQMMLFWLDDDGETVTPVTTQEGKEEQSRLEVISMTPEPEEQQYDAPSIETAKPVAPQYGKTVWPQLDHSVFAGLSGDVTKFEANLVAIELLRELENDCRAPTDEERLVLNRYTGWGGLPQAFNLEQSDKAWVERAERLKSLLTEDEHKSAEASTPNAHYTPLAVVEALWQMVERLGFKGGRILEPAAGTGYFLGGMPTAIAQNSRVTAVELDKLSARFTRALYGKHDVDVLEGGFEQFSLPEGFFDLAIGNVPFGNYKVPEMRNVPYANFMIHDYFFAHSLSLVRPGGLVAFITSSGTMDKGETRTRRYLGSKANLVAAIRLPNSAFKKIANTEVTTDILLFQKPLAGKPDREGWTEAKIVPYGSPLLAADVFVSTYGQQVTCNEYFFDHEQYVIGKLKLVGNGYGKTTGCVFDGDLSEALKERAEMLPCGIYASKSEEVTLGNIVKLGIGEAHRPGFRVIDGKVYEVNGSEAVLYTANQTMLSRIAGMVSIRDAARKLVSAQPVIEDEEVLKKYRVGLNVAYDAFVAKHGYLHEKMNRRAFKTDPDLPLLLSLELWDEESQRAEKADIFNRRTVGVFKRVESCQTVQEALLVCIAETGRVVQNRIAELVGKSASDAMTELEDIGAVFLDPESGYWVQSDEYLSGNVREKLALARVSGDRFSNNVTALETVLPTDLLPHEIAARIGSTWIPSMDYEKFLNVTFDGEDNKVTFNALAGAWDVKRDFRCTWSLAATQVYGTSRINGVELFTMSLNQTVPTIYDPDPKDRDKRIVNQAETIAAREKQQQLKEKFVEWLWSDDVRSTRLVRLYNDIFNSVVTRRYDGQHLVLPGFSRVYELHKHQRDAIWRIVCSGKNTLLAHAVGAGKTLEMICAGMEIRRLGKVSKPMYVVPNHMLEQFAAEFLRAYPAANLLLAGKDDLQGDKRRALLSRIATGDFDGVLITHASFERIKMSDEFMAKFIQDEIDQIEDAIRAEQQDRGNRIVKELARAKKTWFTRLSKLSATDKKDDLLSFEDLGIDQLFYDEAQALKNRFFFSKMGRLPGLPNSNSERAFDGLVKTRYIMSKHGDEFGVVFATGTPVSNSLAELWVMQSYLQHKTLEKLNIGAFDTWAANFGESVTALELDPSGTGYRMQTRFARFVNIPELMTVFREVCDIRTASMLQLPVPKSNTETVVATPTPALKAYVNTLVERAEAIRRGGIHPSVDNMLAITGDGRKAALDLRIIDPDAEDYDGSKVNLCVKRLHQIWTDTIKFKGTQLVFSDLSTPHGDDVFSVYTDIRTKLLALGIPAEQVAFIHDYDSDAAKAELFKAVREGRVRILLGSTGKMGVGTNVQTRLVALHHLDLAWRPSDQTQREGRILRQGNLNEEVSIITYLTESTFDAYMAQGLERKARFIEQIMSGDGTIRSIEDVELAVLSYNELKAIASGNPLVMEKAGIDAELVKLSIMKSKWDEEMWRNRQELSSLSASIERTKEKIEGIESDIASRMDVSGKRFVIEVNGKKYSDRTEAGKAIIVAMHGVRKDETCTIGAISGFPIVAYTSRIPEGKYLMIRGAINYDAGRADTPVGFTTVLVNTLNRMELMLEEHRDYQARQEKRMADIQTELAKPFDKAERFEWLQKRQHEIEDALDLTKGDMSATEGEEEAALAEAA